MDEATLIKKLKEGDEQAFKEVVSLYQRMVINTCFGFIHQYEQSEDVAQDVFVKVYRSIENFRADAKLSTWIYRIAVNLSLNYLRKQNKRSLIERAEIQLYDYGIETVAESSNNQPQAILENKEQADQLHKAIGTLPENQRIAFTLSKYRGESNKAIATIMETSVSSVEALLSRAKKNLQIKLLDYYQNSINIG